MLYLQALQQCQGAAQGIARALAGVYEHALFLESLHSFLGITRVLPVPPDPVPIPTPLEHGIACDGMHGRHAIVRTSRYFVSEAIFTKLTFLHSTL